MNVIPVLDLQAGHVVHARRGQRSLYEPVRSVLAPGSEPLPLARALCRAGGSKVLYVADLDALQGRGPQVDACKALLADDPERVLWLDAGFADREQACHLLEQLGPDEARVHPVFGSESLTDADAAQAALADHPRAILSLDRLGERRLDPSGCWRTPSRWPSRVIVMTLERVGSEQGPDLEALAHVRAQAPHGTRCIGAGGMRDAADLERAAAAGAHAWLVASALHEGRLTAVAGGAP